MKITDIRIRKMQNDPDNRMKAVVSITLDGLLAVHDIRVIDGKERLFVAMPSRKASDDTYKDVIHPISNEFRRYLEEEILQKYQEELEAEAQSEAPADIQE